MGQVLRLGEWRQGLARSQARRRLARGGLLRRNGVPQITPADLREVVAEIRKTVVRLDDVRASIAQYQQAGLSKIQ